MYERIVSTLLTVAALAIALVLVRREFASEAESDLITERMSRVEAFESIVAAGTRIGPPGAPVQLVEFGDFECPFCRKFHAAFEAVRQRHPNAVALTFVHYPLSSHRFAMPVAIAAECARRSGRFEEFTRLVFEKQDSLGLVQVAEIASRAGVDPRAHKECVAEPEVEGVVEAGRRLGDRIGVQYTPTVLINGWRFALPQANRS